MQLIRRISEQLAEPGRQANLQDIRNVLEDGQALAAMGVTDADQETVELAHATVTGWQEENYTRLLVPRYTPPMLLSGKDTSQ
jgi:hypothetical protein